MPYQFPPEIDHLIKQQLASGSYASENEILRDALNALIQRNEDLSAIQAGLDDMRAGRVYALEDVADEIRRKHGFSTRA